VAIGIALANASPEQVLQRLRVYEAIRKNRGSVLQIFSNVGQDEAELIQKEAAKYISAEKVPSKFAVVFVGPGSRTSLKTS
jgi:salicylate hydroxylase